MSDEHFDWGSRRCPIYALQPMRFFGLQTETAAIVVGLVALGKPLLGMLDISLIAIAFAIFYEQLSSGRMPNYPAYWLSSAAGVPAVRRYLPALAKVTSFAWRSFGLPASPTLVPAYEP